MIIDNGLLFQFFERPSGNFASLSTRALKGSSSLSTCRKRCFKRRSHLQSTVGGMAFKIGS
ncbi:uncharacterized protein SEPMUDRAFT_121748 [Sphaerulina musiva SO2202]|uniref:Uncharacterized protein n=1 Tax=Sphaerulina musiva (strain SO2202) TaxID=692275 RepID=M3CUR4_SPHMS|nr:uncharacterized protein SEPMUDRAFT_121748 [Sphaerulina musiva SO2202]EMF07902.1 hypothetical protein SEPMUDRAFT_121748 [Sphaerulina musiva SO2202]